MWTDVSISVTALINGTKTPSSESTASAASLLGSTTGARDMDPPQPTPQPPYVRVCGGCGDTSGMVYGGLSYGCAPGCCFKVSVAGNWSIGDGDTAATGAIKGFADTWHKIGVDIKGGAISATVDGVSLGSVPGSCVPPTPIVFPGHGMVGLGCGTYHYCQFGSFELTAK